jgi:hypothetical protein
MRSVGLDSDKTSPNDVQSGRATLAAWCHHHIEARTGNGQLEWAISPIGWFAKEFIRSPRRPIRFDMDAGPFEVDRAGSRWNGARDQPAHARRAPGQKGTRSTTSSSWAATTTSVGAARLRMASSPSSAVQHEAVRPGDLAELTGACGDLARRSVMDSPFATTRDGTAPRQVPNKPDRRGRRQSVYVQDRRRVMRPPGPMAQSALIQGTDQESECERPLLSSAASVFSAPPFWSRRILRMWACGESTRRSRTAALRSPLQRRREPYACSIALADRNGNLYVSADVGRSWSRRASGLPPPSSLLIV